MMELMNRSHKGLRQAKRGSQEDQSGGDKLHGDGGGDVYGAEKNGQVAGMAR